MARVCTSNDTCVSNLSSHLQVQRQQKFYCTHHFVGWMCFLFSPFEWWCGLELDGETVNGRELVCKVRKRKRGGKVVWISHTE